MKNVKLIGSDQPVAVGKIVCVGRNYEEHAKEMDADVPDTPVLFLKPSTAIIQSGEPIVIPPISLDCHHEVEITLLIGKGGKKLRPVDAPSYIAGYGVGLDMTLRDIQKAAKKQGLPWTLAKGFDTSAPLSDFVPAASIQNPDDLCITLKINGKKRQVGYATEMIFSFSTLTAYISQYMTLEPGDVIFTGTPEGVSAVNKGDRLEATLSTRNNQVLTSLSTVIT
jgi:5-carboxymethyl-2-hydroxymuconate isomerase